MVRKIFCDILKTEVDMAKKGMKRYGPGNGMTKEKQYKDNAPTVPEIQGKAKNSNEKIK